MSKNQEYIEKYKDLAIEMMIKYGIPASVTLAQGIIESANGQSQLAQNENNHFGIKATRAWLDAGGGYGVYTDDKPNEKFCKYATVADSYEHHSQFLKNNQRYAACFQLSPDDYKGWCMGLDKAGYATSGKYGPSLINTIERLNLQDIDRQVMEQMQRDGKTFGVQDVTLPTSQNVTQTTPSPQSQSSDYSMPVKRDEFMLVTSPFGMRMHPIDHVMKMHDGIDIKTNHDALLATESGGKVIGAGYDSKGGGNFVTLEYSREDGSKTQLTYCHLSEINVKVGDTVTGGQQLGVSGSTGKSTGDHLHFAVKQIASDGNTRQIDPAAYLADIAQKGNLQQQALLNGQDLLAKYKSHDPTQGNDNALAQVNPNMTADDWMKKLLSSEDSGLDMGMNGGDPIIEMVMGAFTALMAIAVQIDNKSEEDKRQMVTEAAVAKSIDLTPYMPNHQDCSISVQDGGKAILKVDGLTKVLSQAEQNSLSNILASSLADDAKMNRIAAMVDNIVLSGRASQNYEQAVCQSQEQANVIQR